MCPRTQSGFVCAKSAFMYTKRAVCVHGDSVEGICVHRESVEGVCAHSLCLCSLAAFC